MFAPQPGGAGDRVEEPATRDESFSHGENGSLTRLASRETHTNTEARIVPTALKWRGTAPLGFIMEIKNSIGFIMAINYAFELPLVCFRDFNQNKSAYHGPYHTKWPSSYQRFIREANISKTLCFVMAFKKQLILDLLTGALN